MLELLHSLPGLGSLVAFGLWSSLENVMHFLPKLVILFGNSI